MTYLTAEQILYIHARVIQETGGEYGVLDLGLLVSAVQRPKATFDQDELYPDIFTKAAALLDSLVRNHPFLDGNKRTGIASAGLFLFRNGYELTADNKSLTRFTLECAQSRHSIEEMARWFEQNSGLTAQE